MRDDYSEQDVAPKERPFAKMTKCGTCTKASRPVLPCTEHIVDMVPCDFTGEPFYNCEDYQERTDSVEQVATEMLNFCREYKHLLDDDADIIEGDFATRLKELGIEVE